MYLYSIYGTPANVSYLSGAFDQDALEFGIQDILSVKNALKIVGLVLSRFKFDSLDNNLKIEDEGFEVINRPNFSLGQEFIHFQPTFFTDKVVPPLPTSLTTSVIRKYFSPDQ